MGHKGCHCLAIPPTLLHSQMDKRMLQMPSGARGLASAQALTQSALGGNHLLCRLSFPTGLRITICHPQHSN